MQQALNELFPYALQLFIVAGEEEEFLPGGEELQVAWEAEVRPVLTESNLDIPEVEGPPAKGRDEHTPHLAELVEEMQMVARQEAGAQW